MKELTIEEKAQRYDEALKVAKGLYAKDTPDSLHLERMFPELKERDDEKMELLEHLKSCLSTSSTTIWKKKYQRWIAWLEKQGEQKPADKVEPKFKVGDWVVNTVGDTNQVVKVLDDGYTLDDNTFLSNSWATEHYHLWTIQDAKDGDVLFTSSTASHETFIFKSIDEKGNAKCYFTYDSEDGFREGKYHFIGSATNCKPATKEQCDLLFQKMKEAGYEWDAEKKELKKIEQKFAWSDEDERIFESVLWHLRNSVNNGDTNHSAGQLEIWIKSLKDRYTWKPSDEQMKALTFACIKNAGIDKSSIKALYDLKEQLKQL